MKNVLELDKYDGVIVTGDKDSGKSVFLEWAGEQFYKKGRLTLDLFDAGDFESAFWSTAYPIILVYPPHNKVDASKSSYDIVALCDTIGIEPILERAIKENRVVTFACSLYESNDLLRVLAEWIRNFPNLMIHRFKKTEAIVLVREAANVVFSKYKVTKSQSETQAALLEFLRIARHRRTSYIFDTQRYFDLYVGHRFHFTKRIVKRTLNVPPELKDFDESISQRYPITKALGKRLPNIAYLNKNEFYLIHGDKPILHRFSNPLPSFKHKEPFDDFVELANIKIIETGEFRDIDELNKRQVTELKYLRNATSIIADKIYQRELILNDKPLSFRQWAKETGVSTTVLTKYATKNNETK